MNRWSYKARIILESEQLPTIARLQETLDKMGIKYSISADKGPIIIEIKDLSV